MNFIGRRKSKDLIQLSGKAEFRYGDDQSNHEVHYCFVSIQHLCLDKKMLLQCWNKIYDAEQGHLADFSNMH